MMLPLCCSCACVVPSVCAHVPPLVLQIVQALEELVPIETHGACFAGKGSDRGLSKVCLPSTACRSPTEHSCWWCLGSATWHRLSQPVTACHSFSNRW